MSPINLVATSPNGLSCLRPVAASNKASVANDVPIKGPNTLSKSALPTLIIQVVMFYLYLLKEIVHLF